MIPGLAMAIVGMLLLTRIDAHTAYLTHVLPARVVMSVGLAGVFIPAASTALIGVGHHDAGVASAVLNSSQQIGGSLGTALLNTHVRVDGHRVPRRERASHRHRPRSRAPFALIHGYHVAFIWGAALMAAALLSAVIFVNARKEDVPTEAGVGAV